MKKKVLFSHYPPLLRSARSVRCSIGTACWACSYFVDLLITSVEGARAQGATMFNGALQYHPAVTRRSSICYLVLCIAVI